MKRLLWALAVAPMMVQAQTTINNLPAGSALTGAELVPIWQVNASPPCSTLGVCTYQTTTAVIAAYVSANLSAINLATQVSGVLGKSNGGTGTASPGLVAGANIAVTGAWPNQTIAVTGLAPVATSGSASDLLAGTLPAARIPSTSVIAATYGDGTHVGQFTVGADGRLTAASSVTITGAAPTGAAGGVLSGSYPNPGFASTTGTGAVVQATSPTLVTPNLGMPSVIDLTNATDAPTWNQNTTGNAATATALAAAPTQCSGVQVATGIAASGNANCSNLPNPAASTLGGIESLTAVSHEWINAISTSGVPSATQPSAADLSNGVSGTGAVVLATGNAATATALAAVPTNCGAGVAATGVLANGNATGCFTPSVGSVPFNDITAGTNTTAAMNVGTGASIGFVNNALWITTGAGGGTFFNTNNSGAGDRYVYFPATDSALLGLTGANLTYTVSTLPTCNSSTNKYQFAVVTDATSPTYNGALTGSGSVVTLAWCNGSSWTAH